MNKLTRSLLYLVIFNIPFENSIRLPVVGNFTNLLLLMLVVSTVLTVLSNREIKRLPIVYILVFLFSLLIITSFYWGSTSYLNVFNFILYMQGFFLFWVIFEFLDTEEKINQALKSFVLGCIVILGISLNSYFTMNIGSAGRFVLEGYNANAMGVIWVLGICIALYLTFTVSKKYFLYVPFAMFMVLVTASRTAFVLLLFVGVAALWYLFSRKIRYRKTLVLIGSVFLLIALNFVPQAQLDRLSSIDDEIAEGDLSGRTAIWENGISAFKESPFWGSGVGSFKEATISYTRNGVEMSSHNSYLTILVETGILGSLIFALLLLSLLVYALRTKFDRSMRWLSVVLIVLWLILSFASHAELQKYTWMIFGIIVAIHFTNLKKSLVVNGTQS